MDNKKAENKAFTIKNKNTLQPVIDSYPQHLHSPQFNSSLENDNQDFNITFKNSKAHHINNINSNFTSGIYFYFSIFSILIFLIFFISVKNIFFKIYYLLLSTLLLLFIINN